VAGEEEAGMGGRATGLLVYALVMVALIVAVDVAFLRHQLGLRLAVNVGIVLLFGVFYVLFLRHL
jgi:hypothetical protein